jgi:hypothetical protein
MGNGVIQIGSVQAEGKWKQTDGFLVVTLKTAALGSAHKSQLAEYCTSCDPLVIQLPGQLQPANCTITGFGRGTHATTLYLSEAAEKPQARRVTK